MPRSESIAFSNITPLKKLYRRRSVIGRSRRGAMSSKHRRQTSFFKRLAKGECGS
jgi:hypothetical protein